MGKGTRANIVKDSVTALGHPSISPDGKYLYFVSDAVGGYGGKDLFRARVVGSDFGSMENLGPDINTPGDEMFPYVRDSVTLYFASDGHREWVGWIFSKQPWTARASGMSRI